MAVIRTAESHTGTTGSVSQASFTFAVGQAGDAPKGILVFVFQGVLNTDEVSSVTYGGTDVPAVTGGRAEDTTTEKGSCKAFFLGASVPSGVQSVVVNRSNTTTTMYAVAYLLSGSMDNMRVEVTPYILSNNAAMAQQSIVAGAGTTQIFAAAYSGGVTVPTGASMTIGTGTYLLYSAYAFFSGYETTPTTGTRTRGLTCATDDLAYVIVTVGEVSAVSQTLTPTYDVANKVAQTLTPAYDMRQVVAQVLGGAAGGIVETGLLVHYRGAKAKGGTDPGDNADAGTRATWDNLVGTPDGSLAGSWAWTAANGWAGSGSDADPYRLELGATSGDYVTNTADATQTGGHTWEAWVRHTDAVNAVGLFTHGNGSVANIGEFRCSNGGSTNRPLLYLGGSNYRYWVDPGAGVRDGGYHHWVVTLPGDAQTDVSAATLTVDGVLISAYSTVTTTVQAAWTNGLLVGWYAYVTPVLAVPAFRAYSRVLGTTEIAQNYGAGVNGDVGAATGVTYDVLNLAAQTLTPVYDIQASLAQVSQTLTPVYDMRSLVLDPAAFPTVWAHHGSDFIYPQDTLTAYQNNLDLDGCTVVWPDVQILSDGSLGVMHDTTVDRTTTSTGNVADLDEAGFRALVCDPSTYLAAGWANEHPPMLEDLLSEFGDQVLFVLDCKGTSTAVAASALVASYGLQSSCVIQSFAVGDGAAIASYGVPWMLYSNTDDAATYAAAGATYLTCDSNVTSLATYCANAHAAGLKVVYYPGDNSMGQAKTAGYLAVADSVLNDDWAYATNSHVKLTQDTFSTSKHMHGMLAVPHNGAYQAPTGFFPVPGRFGFPALSTYQSCLMGWSCPLPDAEGSYSIAYTATFDTVPADASSSHCIVFGCPTDIPWTGNPGTGLNGYMLLYRANGEAVLYKMTDGAGFVSLAVSGTWGAVTSGASVPLRIDVTPAGITVSRTDGAHTFTSTDTTYRGAYWHFACPQKSPTGLACSISGITISVGLTLVAQTLTPLYDTRQLAAQTLSPTYNLAQLVAQILTPVYGVNALVAQTLTPTYLMRQLAAATLTPLYDLRQLAGQTLTPVYSMRQVVAGSLTPTYNLLSLIAQTLSPAYDVRVLAAQSLTPAYDVRTLAAQTLTPAYALRQLAGQTLTPSYDVRQAIAATLTPVYSILAIGLTAVAQTLTPTYLIRQLAAQTLTPAYAIRNLAAQTLAPEYDLRQLVASSLSPAYDIMQLVAATLAPAYDVRELVSGTLTPQYDLRELVSASLAPVYTILGVFGPDLAFVVTLMPRGWHARLLREGWSVETQPSGWKAAVRRNES